MLAILLPRRGRRARRGLFPVGSLGHCVQRLLGAGMELNTTIDRQSYVPLYVQVKDSLRDLILGGRAPGEQLPGEPELCRRYDVTSNSWRRLPSIF